MNQRCNSNCPEQTGAAFSAQGRRYPNVSRPDYYNDNISKIPLLIDHLALQLPHQ